MDRDNQCPAPSGDSESELQATIPNKFTLGELCFCILCAAALFGYGLYSFIEGRLVLPARAGAFAVTSYLPTGIFFLGALSWAAGLIAVVIDHFDERDNEHLYDTFEQWAHRA